MTGGTARARGHSVAYTFLDFDDGGAQRLALTTWRHLDRSRFRPVLVCVRREGALVDAAVDLGVPVHVLHRLERSRDVRALSVIAGLFSRIDASIVHVPLYSRVSPYARLAARLARVPLVVAHEHCRASAPSLARRAVDAVLLPGTRFVAVSEAMRAELVRSGVPAASAAVVGNGVDIERFAPVGRAAARERLGLPASGPVVLVPARLVRRKGHVTLVAATPELLRRCPTSLVLLAGAGPLHDVLAALIGAAGLAEHVRLLGHRDDMPDLFAAADVVCLPSRIEGMPLAILEAMAAGRAAVAADAGGVSEAVRHGVTGLLVAPDDSAALAAALSRLLADEPARRAMEVRAREVAVEHFGAPAMVRRLESLYSEWLGDAAAGPLAPVREASAPPRSRDGACR